MNNPADADRLFTLLQSLHDDLTTYDRRIRSLEVWRGYIIGIVSALLFVSSIVLALR